MGRGGHHESCCQGVRRPWRSRKRDRARLNRNAAIQQCCQQYADFEGRLRETDADGANREGRGGRCHCNMALFGCGLLRDRCCCAGGWRNDAMNDRTGKSIFITGTSSGLGRATAKLFASRGWKVIATMRNPERDAELKNISGVTLMSLDITHPQQIKTAAEQAVAIHSIDVVFNNAGYGLAGPLEGLADEQIIRMVNTNLMGTIRTTKAFIPHFREKRSGLFINTTSIGGLITVPFNSIYHATKWALEGWSESMAFELNQLGIGMKTVSPGGMKTDFFTRSFDTGRHPAYTALVDKVLSAVTEPKQMETYSSPDQIAEVVYEAATDGKDQLRYVAGADAKATYATRLQLGDESFRRAMDKQFFGSGLAY